MISATLGHSRAVAPREEGRSERRFSPSWRVLSWVRPDRSAGREAMRVGAEAERHQLAEPSEGGGEGGEAVHVETLFSEAEHRTREAAMA